MSTSILKSSGEYHLNNGMKKSKQIQIVEAENEIFSCKRTTFNEIKENVRINIEKPSKNDYN